MGIDDAAFASALEGAIDGARALDDVAGWLRRQPAVRSVRLTDGMLKSNPPQREFIVDVASSDGSARTCVVTVYDLGEGRYRFAGLRDA
jgi:hypothetical protein